MTIKISPALTSLFRLGSGRLQRWKTAAGAEVPLVAPSFPPRESEILTSESDYSGLDWVSIASNTDWLTLPVASLRWPRLKRVGVVHWDITANYFNTAAGSQDIEFELMVDGAASGSSLTWTESAGCDSNGVLVFTADLRVIGDYQGGTRHMIEARLLVVNGTGVQALNSTKFLLPTLDSTADRTLGWRCRKATSVANTRLEVQSIGCIQSLYTSGG